jgi:hypothetical protein
VVSTHVAASSFLGSAAELYPGKPGQIAVLPGAAAFAGGGAGGWRIAAGYDGASQEEARGQPYGCCRQARSQYGEGDCEEANSYSRYRQTRCT